MVVISPTVTAADELDKKRGVEALERLRSADPPLYLSPSPELAQDARTAACYLFSSLVQLCPKPPLDNLLAGEGFDSEQVWYQIDLLSRPLLSLLRRELNRVERELPAREPVNPVGSERDGKASEPEKDIEHEDDGSEDGNEIERDEEGEEKEEALEDDVGHEDDDDDDEEEEEKEEEEEEEEDRDEENGNRVEDKFLKIKDLEEYLLKAEEKEYGLPERKGSRREEEELDEQEDEENDEDDDDENDEEDDMDEDGFDSDGHEDMKSAENARYEDFFGGNIKKKQKKDGISGKRKQSSSSGDFVDGPESTEMDVEENDREGQKFLSTHEKELQKLHAKIEQMEKENLEPKSWTMQGEVMAASRPKNSALEVDLDFEHNVRPVPVITEEVTASLEDIIRKRIIEGHFDDVQRAPTLPSKAPKEQKELDEQKSKKGLAEIYEEEYAQKSGLAPTPLSGSDALKNEASMLFKNLCSKLDALSHFHFAPKPVIEDMSIQVNLPALAMEEVAPLAVSDASMLAPEEIFQGEGDIKEDAELTKAERKKRRANKKRRFKAETSNRAAKKAGQISTSTSTNGKPDS